MASNRDEQNGVTRRDFATRVGAAAAGSRGRRRPAGARAPRARPAAGRVLGANDRVVISQVGIRGQGNSLKRGFAQLKNVEIKTLCDIDGNLAPSRINDERLKDVATFKPNFVQDLRRVLDDKDIDAIVVAIPNHWHALATVWGLQAGKHVYIEKPASHTVWEGRRMVEATKRFNKIVQVGTMNRSRPAVQQAIKFMQEGGIGKVYMARGLCFKPRPSIGKYPDGPMAPGEKYKLNVEATTRRADLRRAVPVEGGLRPVARARRRSGRSTATGSTTTGTGTGTTATATPATRARTSSTSRAGASASRNTRSRSARWAATSAASPRRKRRTCRPRCSSTPTARSSSSPPAASTPTTKAASADRQPVLRHEGLAVDGGVRQDLAVVHGADGRQEREGSGLGQRRRRRRSA